MQTYTTVKETLQTLQTQVSYLEKGTNPIVFFPSDTPIIPQLPQGMKSLKKEMGVFYFNPRYVTESIIEEAIQKDAIWAVLGFVQDKKEAIKNNKAIVIIARDSEGNEIKSAVVDSEDERVASLQAFILYQWFPDCVVKSET